MIKSADGSEESPPAYELACIHVEHRRPYATETELNYMGRHLEGCLEVHEDPD